MTIGNLISIFETHLEHQLKLTFFLIGTKLEPNGQSTAKTIGSPKKLRLGFCLLSWQPSIKMQNQNGILDQGIVIRNQTSWGRAEPISEKHKLAEIVFN